jgi:DNA polymerase III subunit alpha
VAFQTAYMKAYHPVEYMAALLTYEMGSTDKVVEYIEESRRLTLPDGRRGIQVLPPDVNVSGRDFTPVYGKEVRPEPKKKREAARVPEGTIRFGLCAIRGVGEKAVEAIIEERSARGPFSSLYDFCERIDSRQVNRSTIEALIRCGAFASLGAARAQLLHVLEGAIEMGQQSQQDKRSGQLNMFAAAASPAAAPPPPPALPDVDEFPKAELLKFEKELLGFYISSHPLTEHQSAIERYTTASTREAMNCAEGVEVTIGGMIAMVKTRIAKSGRSAGQKWAIIALEDLDGKIEGMVFSDAFAEMTQRDPNLLSAERIVFVRGKVDRKRETPCLVVNEIIPVEDAVGRLTTALVLKLDRTRRTVEDVMQIRPVLQRYRGNVPVFVQLPWNDSQTVMLRLGQEQFVRATPEIVGDLEQCLGSGAVQLCGAGTKRQKRLAQQQLFEETPAESIGSTSDAQSAAELDEENEAMTESDLALEELAATA